MSQRIIVDAVLWSCLLLTTIDQPPLRETFDILIGEPEIVRQSLTAHAREPFSVAQIVDFYGDFDQDIVRGMEPVAEHRGLR
jgi:hypothetical protein